MILLQRSKMIRLTILDPPAGPSLGQRILDPKYLRVWKIYDMASSRTISSSPILSSWSAAQDFREFQHLRRIAGFSDLFVSGPQSRPRLP